MNESPNPPPSRCGDQGLPPQDLWVLLTREATKEGSLGVARDSCLDPAEGAGEEVQLPGRPGRPQEECGVVGGEGEIAQCSQWRRGPAGSCVSGRQHPGKMNRRRQCPTSTLMFKLL